MISENDQEILYQRGMTEEKRNLIIDTNDREIIDVLLTDPDPIVRAHLHYNKYFNENDYLVSRLLQDPEQPIRAAARKQILETEKFKDFEEKTSEVAIFRGHTDLNEQVLDYYEIVARQTGRTSFLAKKIIQYDKPCVVVVVDAPERKNLISVISQLTSYNETIAYWENKIKFIKYSENLDLLEGAIRYQKMGRRDMMTFVTDNVMWKIHHMSCKKIISF